MFVVVKVELAKGPLPRVPEPSRGPVAFRAPCRGDGEENPPAYGAQRSFSK
jgi:hypothetical protein